MFPDHIKVLFLTHKCVIAGSEIRASKSSEGQHCFTARPIIGLRWLIERFARGDPFDAVVFELANIPADINEFIRGAQAVLAKSRLFLLCRKAEDGSERFACDYHRELANEFGVVVWSQAGLFQELAVLKPLPISPPIDIMVA